MSGTRALCDIYFTIAPLVPLRPGPAAAARVSQALTLVGAPKNDFSTARHSKYLCDTTPCKANGEEVYVLSCHGRAHKAQGRNSHGHVDRPKGVIWPLVEKL